MARTLHIDDGSDPLSFNAVFRSEEFQAKLTPLIVNEITRRASLPGEDGKTNRRFVMDWFYLQRPLLDRFKGARFNVQFEGPELIIGTERLAIGCMIERDLEWVRMPTDESVNLRRSLQEAVDREVENWIAGRPMKFLPATPQKPFPDREAADAEAAQIVREAVAATGNPGGE